MLTAQIDRKRLGGAIAAILKAKSQSPEQRAWLEAIAEDLSLVLPQRQR
jgi:hypothetical protein